MEHFARIGRALLVVLFGLCLVCNGRAASLDAPSPSFQDFQVGELFSGNAQFPDFAGRDKAFRNYRTRIREGLSEGPNFAGTFSVVQIGCGSGCSLLFVASSVTGEVFRFPRGALNPSLQALYRPDSRLFVVQWVDYEAERCILEYFNWNGTAARLLATKPIGGLDVCGPDIRQNVAADNR